MIVDCTPLYVQILEQIENEICTGKWQEGKRIPSAVNWLTSTRSHRKQ